MRFATARQHRTGASEDESKTNQRNSGADPREKRPLVRQMLLRSRFGWNFMMFRTRTHTHDVDLA
jgi:hypothetical protein